MYGVSICSSRIVDTGLMTSLLTSSRNNRCRNFGSKYLGNEARQRDGSNYAFLHTQDALDGAKVQSLIYAETRNFNS